jgi:hypothetical protein
MEPLSERRALLTVQPMVQVMVQTTDATSEPIFGNFSGHADGERQGLDRIGG